MSDIDRYEGVVVLGFPRSGTTLLRRLVDAHPVFCCPPETYVLNACARFLHRQEITGGLELGVLGALAFCGISAEEVIQRLRDLAFGFFRQIRDKSGKRRWVERSAFDIFYIDAVESICGDRCRYICLVRHPLDVICSAKEWCDELEVFPSLLHKYVQRHKAPLEAFAHAWVDTNTRLLKFMGDHPGWCLRLRYEDLVTDAPAELERVFAFLDEPTDTQALVQRALAGRDRVGIGDWKTYSKAQITGSSVGRWQGLSTQRLARLAEIVNPLLQQFGYPPVEVETSTDPEKARHSFEVRMWVARLKSEMTGADSASNAERINRTVAGTRREQGS